MSISVVSLLEKLVGIPSVFPPGDTSAICTTIAAYLKDWGYAVELVSRLSGFVNVVARMGNPANGPCVVFNSHIDTVSHGRDADWHTPPYTLSDITGGRLAGLGAANCKGSAATHLWLAHLLAQRGGPEKGEVVFTFVGDEESLGPNGTCYLAESGLVKPDILILGAPTSNQLVVRERGVMWVGLTVYGKGAHAGAPETGDNAILKLMHLLSHLQAELAPRLASRTTGVLRSTMNIGTITGGANTNVVPAQAYATIDRRLLPEVESVEEAMSEIAMLLAVSGVPGDDYRLELLTGTNGFSAASDSAVVQAFRTAGRAVSGSEPQMVEALGASDGRHFSDQEIQIVNFGPGEGEQGHAPNESVSRIELETACLVLEKVLAHLTGYRSWPCKP